MPNYASITVIGHLGRDPETRDVGDNSVTNFSIAVTHKRKGKEDQTTWYNCAAWNKTGQLAQQYLKKGSVALVTGTPRLEEYTDKNGAVKSKLVVEVANVVFLDRRGETAAPGEKNPEEVELKEGDGLARLKAAMASANQAGSTDQVPF
jgi:single-strand DNA-binding protein